MSAGKLGAEIAHLDNQSEIGDLARALDRYRTSTAEAARATALQAAAIVGIEAF